ncbi:MAG TPA: carboxymuconolactone decarboxylase family protein [Planctomycetota bacterium]|nr:carboxymuconolactone decarboxylase family protein [Planctomycetota bacterium]
MAWIGTVSPSEATGLLKILYDEAVGRAGKVFQIVRLMSANPEVLRASMGLYLSAVRGPSPLPRAVREMIAVVVSSTNRCHY